MIHRVFPCITNEKGEDGIAMSTNAAKDAAKKERQEKKKRIRQEQLIDAAEKIFITHGYDTTTLEMVADELGYTKRTLYLYFRDKDDIFFAVTLKGLSGLHDALSKAVVVGETGLDRMFSLGTAYYQFFRQHPVYFEFNRIFETKMYYFQKELNGDSGEFAFKCQEVNDRITRLLLDVIEDGQADGSITLKYDSKKLMLLLWGGTFGLLEVVFSRMDKLEDIYGTSADEMFSLYTKLLEGIFR